MFETWHIISLIAVYLCIGLLWSRLLVWRRWSRLWYWCFRTVDQLTSSHPMSRTYRDMLCEPVTPGTIGLHFIGWPVALLLIAFMTAYFLLLLVLIYPCSEIVKLVLKKSGVAIAQCAK